MKPSSKNEILDGISFQVWPHKLMPTLLKRNSDFCEQSQKNQKDLYKAVVRLRETSKLHVEMVQITKDSTIKVVTNVRKKRVVDRSTRQWSPEILANFLGLMLNRQSRERYFEPHVEDIKRDRLEQKARDPEGADAKLVDAIFYWRFAKAYFSSSLCSLMDSLRRWSPIAKWIAIISAWLVK